MFANKSGPLDSIICNELNCFKFSARVAAFMKRSEPFGPIKRLFIESHLMNHKVGENGKVSSALVFNYGNVSKTCLRRDRLAPGNVSLKRIKRL